MSPRSAASRALGRLRGESGASTVELALVLPLLLVVLIGAVQFALVQHAEDVASTAAAEGSRLAAADGGSAADGAARAQSVLAAGLGAAGGAFAVTTEDQGDVVVTEADGAYPLFIPWVTRLAIPIHATSEVRKEGFRSGP